MNTSNTTTTNELNITIILYMSVLVDTNQSDVWWFTCRYRNVSHMDNMHYSPVHFGFAHRN